MNQDLVKLDRFDGNNYARWKDKMMFLLTALRISYILDLELSPPPEEPRTSVEGVPAYAEEIKRVKKERKKREEDKLLCRGHILNELSDHLYDLFTEIKSARDIWSALDYKYKAEEEGTNKYLITQYFDFVMVDDKPVLQQVHALQDYQKKLLDKSEDFTLEQFQKHLRIEEESRKRENKVTVPVESNVHYVDGSGSKSKNPTLQNARGGIGLATMSLKGNFPVSGEDPAASESNCQEVEYDLEGERKVNLVRAKLGGGVFNRLLKGSKLMKESSVRPSEEGISRVRRGGKRWDQGGRKGDKARRVSRCRRSRGGNMNRSRSRGWNRLGVGRVDSSDALKKDSVGGEIRANGKTSTTTRSLIKNMIARKRIRFELEDWGDSPWRKIFCGEWILP
ncbi:hypothetical protein RJ639_040291 [Escallonia herrerae]|uniref:DUF4219 domain-containing protein n=1 Tax=Escallonia herrerae TaxID=1293975 RepID=A0AA88WL36_9ASTE|nr:hypothetical protein RJ639_040291 [Escallonia herrerae]